MSSTGDQLFDDEKTILTNRFPSQSTNLHYQVRKIMAEDILEDVRSQISKDDLQRLNSGPGVSQFQRDKLDRDAKKNWDLFYKRNGDRFFKHRYWTRNEFKELFSDSLDRSPAETIRLLEVGCGCGNFVIPLLQDDTDSQIKLRQNLFIYCCDISDEAVKILRSSTTYMSNQSRVKAFVADMCDSTTLNDGLENNPVDIVTMIFVLSALDPEKMSKAVDSIYNNIKPGGIVLFRDYAIYDKAMLRFKESCKISDSFYVRQDGTRAYFFSKQELLNLFSRFRCQSIDYVKRETVNKATNDKFPRLFLQAKFSR